MKDLLDLVSKHREERQFKKGAFMEYFKQERESKDYEKNLDKGVTWP